MTEILAVHAPLREGRQEHHRNPAKGEKVPPFSPSRQPAVWGGRGQCPLEVCLLAASPPPFHPLVQRLNAEGSHMVLCGHIFPSTVSSWCECRARLSSVSCPSPPLRPPSPCSQPRDEQVVGGKLSESGSPADSGRLSRLSITPTHTLPQKTVEVKSDVSKSDPFLV